MSNITQTDKRPPFGGVATTLVCLWVYAAVLYYAFKFNIAPDFAYQGLAYREPDLFGLTVAIIAVSVTGVVMPRRIRKASHFVLWVLFIVGAAPAILIPQYAPIVSAKEANIVGLNVAGAMILIRVLASFNPIIGGSNLRLHVGRLFWVVTGLFSAVVYTLVIAFNGIDVQIVALTDVYDLRSEFAAATTAVPILGYLLPIQQNVINPIFIARGAMTRRAFPLFVGIFGQLLIYISAGQKTVLFSIGAILAVLWLYRRSSYPHAAVMLAAVTVGAILSVLTDKLTGTILTTSLFIRRFLVVPGALVAAYVAVFTNRPKTNFADSLLPFLTDPYEGSLRPSYIVGQVFVGNVDTNANVSLFGHGFLSFGYLGMYIEAAVLAVILWLIDDAAEGLSLAVTSSILLMPAVAISSASVFTAILTHGLFAAVIVISAIPRGGWHEGPKVPKSARG